MLKLPDEFRDALTVKVADEHGISLPQASLWIGDIEEKGTQSIYFEQVKPIAMKIIEPVWSMIKPVLEDLARTAYQAALHSAKAINDANNSNI